MIRPTSAKAAEYLWFGHHCLSLGEVGSKVLIDGLVTVICDYDRENATLIATTADVFFAHPRNDEFLNGRTPAGEALTAPSVFPLIDRDNGSAIIDLTGALTRITGGDYGNTHDAAALVSWRGPSGKYLPNADEYIPGFTRDRTDETSAADPVYTPFDRKLYRGGKLQSPEPSGEVLCAAIISGTVWAVVQPLPENDNQLLIRLTGNAWEEVARRPAFAVVPCVFQADRIILNNVVGGSGEWTLAGEWTPYDTSDGQLVRGDGWHVTKTVTGVVLFPGVTIRKDSTDMTGGTDVWVSTYGDIEARSLVDTPLTWVSAPTFLNPGFNDFDAAGGTPPYTYSGDDIDPDTGVLLDVGQCGMVTVTVTDRCGNELTHEAYYSNSEPSWTATSVDTSQVPVGWTTGEWHYSGTKRSKLNVAVYYYSTVYVGESNACATYGGDGWSGSTYYAILGASGGIGHCSGFPGFPQSFWDGDCTEDGSDHRLSTDPGSHAAYTGTPGTPGACNAGWAVDDFRSAPYFGSTIRLVKRGLEVFNVYAHEVVTQELVC